MHTNDTNNTNRNLERVIYPELSYTLTGICFDAHNELGRFAREQQYGDGIEKRLQELKIPYQRELLIPDRRNRVDFIVDGKIVLELKAKRIITKEDYYQMQRYLQMFDARLGLLINFRNRYIKPQRIVKIETNVKGKLV